MENSKQYQRYKKQFKTECIFKVAASAVALITLIFLLFIPCFRISLASSAEEAEIMKTLGISPYRDFSLFDEMIQSLKSFGGGSGDPAGMVTKMLSVYQILAMVCIIAAVVWFAIDCVKSGMGIVNPDNYSLLAYDGIKSRAGEKKRRRYLSPINFFFTGIILEIMYIIMYQVLPFSSEGEGDVSGGYFTQMTGVSGAIAVVIIFAVAAVGLLVYDKILKNKIKTAILKEDYNLNAEQTASSESEA